jgi:glucosamine-6-phosphate deaminase
MSTERPLAKISRYASAGTVAKKDLGEEDIRLVVDLFQQIKPHQIYAAGDLSDPHGTHRTCLKVHS